MKAILIFITILFSSTLLGQTTQEEYTWVTKSYVRVLTEGADIKRGYVITDLISSPGMKSAWGNDNKFEFKLLKKENETKTRAMIIVHYFNKTVKTVYCVPDTGSDNSLWQSFFNSIDLLAGNQKSQLLLYLSVLYIENVDKK